jgi:hypothetical protein
MTVGFPGNNTETRGPELGVATTMTARQLTIGTYSGPAMGSWLLGRISFLTSMFYRVAMTDTGYVSTKKEQAHMIERRTCGAYLCLPTRELRRHPRHEVRNSRMGLGVRGRQADADTGPTRRHQSQNAELGSDAAPTPQCLL